MNQTTYIPERRPLGARNWNASHAAAAWLASRGVSPNAISISGFFASLGAGLLFAQSRAAHPEICLLGGCLLILARGMCNMLDGMVAVSTGRASRGGELFNEVPDRLSDSAILVGAGYAAGGLPVLGYVAALAAVFTAYVRVQGCALGTPADFSGPMAKTHRMIVVVIAALGTAAASMFGLPFSAGGSDIGFLAVALVIVILGCLITAGRRLRRCAQFLQKEVS